MEKVKKAKKERKTRATRRAFIWWKVLQCSAWICVSPYHRYFRGFETDIFAFTLNTSEARSSSHVCISVFATVAPMITPGKARRKNFVSFHFKHSSTLTSILELLLSIGSMQTCYQWQGQNADDKQVLWVPSSPYFGVLTCYNLLLNIKHNAQMRRVEWMCRFQGHACNTWQDISKWWTERQSDTNKS